MADGGDEDLTGVMWTDKVWQSLFPLTEETVMDYFAASQFYDRSCNNELVRMQRLDPSLLATMEGIEYSLEPVKSPGVFRISKNMRKTAPAPSVELLATYYVVNGNVYQAPTAHKVISSRVLQSLYHLRSAFDTMQSHAVVSPSEVESARRWDPPPTTLEALMVRANVEPHRSDAGAHESRAIDRIMYNLLDKNRRIAAAAEGLKAAESSAKPGGESK